MKNDPILETITTTEAEKEILREHCGDGYDLFTIRGGLHYIRGNPAPYFSITTRYGASHELIEALRPGKYTDLINHHLFHHDGADRGGNAWYWAGGNRQWNKGGDRDPPNTTHLARCLSIPVYSSTEVSAELLSRGALSLLAPEDLPLLLPFMDERGGLRDFMARHEFDRFCEAQKPRWKEEADRCIERHGLKVFGDKWEGAE